MKVDLPIRIRARFRESFYSAVFAIFVCVRFTFYYSSSIILKNIKLSAENSPISPQTFVLPPSADDAKKKLQKMEFRHTGVLQLTSPKQMRRPPDNINPGHVHQRT